MSVGNTEIYQKGAKLKYGLYTDVEFVRKEKIKHTNYVVLVDKFGNEKKVYQELFEKHARVMAGVPHEQRSN